MLVVGFGDSITEAKGVPIQDTFLYHIGQAFKCKTINSGIGGNTTAMAIARMNDDVIRHRPDLCIIQFGMNDHVMMAPGTPSVGQDEFRKNLKHMSKELYRINCSSVLCTIHPILPGNAKAYYYRRHPDEWYQPFGVEKLIEQYNQIIRDTAGEHGALLADIASHWQDYLNSGGSLTKALQTLENGPIDDGVHLTDIGYSLYAQCLTGVIQQTLV